MNTYRLDARDDRKLIFSGHIRQGGTNPQGEELAFTNYYMERDGKPFFAVCGEFHFSRYDERLWEDEIVKMKMGGINVIATYVFWNMHEEIQGAFEWSGNKDLRKFVALCGTHGLYVIVRIGPFCHGEVRNGGMPDWLFGRPFNVRSNDEGYLAFVEVLYQEIGNQLQGLLYAQGGPIIGTQIENEHNHSAAQWALTTGISNLWLSQGSDGDAHLIKLKQLAVEAGIVTPIYTCTAWGGATTPTEEMLPLWGGYAYWPWIYYEHDRFGDRKEHPPTPEYLFRDKHNNEIPKSYNFEPLYTPEDYPYMCCEMGGGMTPFYKYRFQFDYMSVPAMTGMKVAEGCNMIGYYMYHGGSNPKGKRDLYLNDLATPKISYDFNAMIGEFGQVRESYRRTKLQHYFYTQYEDWLCRTKTLLPIGASDIEPTDVSTLRFAVRAAEGSGLLFLNNYQDHVENMDLEDIQVSIELQEETIRFPAEGGMRVKKDSHCMLPYQFDLGGIRLKYATAQLITHLLVDGEIYYFFAIPDGMRGEFAVQTTSLQAEIKLDQGSVRKMNDVTIVTLDEADMVMFSMQAAVSGEVVHVVALSDAQSLDFWKAEVQGIERVFMTSSNLLVMNGQIKLESTDERDVMLRVFPDLDASQVMSGAELVETSKQELFTTYLFRIPYKEIKFDFTKVSADKAEIRFATDAFQDVKQVLLRVNYTGDIGYAFIDGDLINDNFSNGLPWEIGLKQFEQRLIDQGMYIYISPIRKGSFVNSHTTMAGWHEQATERIADLQSIQAVPVYEIIIGV
ncbi:glycosyl hydrolase family 35 [Paenibacillus sp. Soil766]|uniref:beta-galactosidase n=1 Tax=Paenibacillus sp. Soil766 TaxID=1736404 RepID=UPI00070F4A4E|nr:beta-galactosidase [Paenibacillus sp. Soil766]KRF10060.1 glycosyl hydrolase family 35 [Paenibacillus sp. Soil766]